VEASAIAENAFEFIRKNYRMETFLKNALEEIM
ncbi:unnamed protein product, partial [marine sediment metagenome]